MKKILLLAGVGAAYAFYESGFAEALLNPNPDDDDSDEEVIDSDEPNLDINNPFALMAISLATQVGLKAGAKAASKAVRARNPPPKTVATKTNPSVKPVPQVATTTSTKAPEKPKTAAVKAADKGGVKVATQANQAAQVVQAAPKPIAGPAAKSAAKAAKGSSLLGKLKGTPADLIVMVIAQILTAVLDLDPDSFKDCETGEMDLGKLPDWAQAIIGGVPFLSDLFDLLGNKMCLKAGCPKDTEDSGGLCYKACAPGFKSDGATICYKQYPEFENNGMGHTLTSITKKVLLDTGEIPSECGENEEKIGLICYEKVDGFTNVAGTVWQNCPPGHTDTGIRCEKNTDVGVGRVPRLSDCPAGWINDGLTCRAPITYSSCSPGDVDDGLLCRVPLRGGGCRTWSDGCCSRGLFGECWGCLRTHCEPITGGNVYHKTASGGQVETRTLLGPSSSEDRIDGLDYNKCPEGQWRVPGMPYLCSSSFTKQSRVLNPRGAKCKKRPAPAGVSVAPGTEERDTEITGLCYKSIPPGYSRKVLGTLDQDCPAGSTDFGVGCSRESYSRGAGLIPLGIRLKDRK